MNHDYQPYVYKLANLDNKFHKVLAMDNLFAKFFILGIIGLVCAVAFEIIVDITTNFGFYLVNLVRVLEYEPKIDFMSHGFSVLILGNFIAAIFLVACSIGASIHATFNEIKQYVHGAQQEISKNKQKEKSQKKASHQN